MWKETQLITLSRASPLVVIRWNIVVFADLKEYIADVPKLYFVNQLANQEVLSKSKKLCGRSSLDVNVSETF